MQPFLQPMNIIQFMEEISFLESTFSIPVNYCIFTKVIEFFSGKFLVLLVQHGKIPILISI